MNTLFKAVLTGTVIAIASGSVFAQEKRELKPAREMTLVAPAVKPVVGNTVVSGSTVSTNVAVDNINQSTNAEKSSNNLDVGNISGGAHVHGSTINTTVTAKSINQTTNAKNSSNNVRVGNIGE